MNNTNLTASMGKSTSTATGGAFNGPVHTEQPVCNSDTQNDMNVRKSLNVNDNPYQKQEIHPGTSPLEKGARLGITSEDLGNSIMQSKAMTTVQSAKKGEEEFELDQEDNSQNYRL